MKYNVVVFDLDGTLVDSLDDLADSMNYALVQNGLEPHEADSYKAMIGNGVRMLASRAVGARQDLIEPVVTLMREHYAGNALNKTRVYEGLEKVVAALKARGAKLAVLTNKDDVFAGRIVEHFFSKGVFDRVWGAAPGRAIKPDPAALRELLAALGATAKEAVFIGDSGVDMDVARACGVRSVGVTWGFRDRQELAEHKAGLIIDRPDMLLESLT